MRFRCDIEFEGTRYSGWQIQKNARTVQGEFFGALRTILGSDDFEFMGAGRTDAGVHAFCQTAHLEAKTTLAPHILQLKLNDALPADISVLSVQKVRPDFHARHSARYRSYVYQISRRRTAFGKRFVWWIKDTLDAEAMGNAAVLFEGMHDFRSFTADNPHEKSTKSKIETCALYEHGDLLVFHIVGSHFLWNQVRRMVGTLVEVGRGKLTEREIQTFLKEHHSKPAEYTAPPSGLFFERAYYDGEDITEFPKVLNVL